MSHIFWSACFKGKCQLVQKRCKKFYTFRTLYMYFSIILKTLSLHSFSQTVDLNSDDKWTNQSSQEIGWDWRWGS